MKTFPVGHNPYDAPVTPGYRFLALTESPKATDESWNGPSNWLALDEDHDLIDQQRLSIRRALCVDDRQAPPPDQWSVPGWTVNSRPYPPYAMDGWQLWCPPGDEPWGQGLEQWIDINRATPMHSQYYYRYPVHVTEAPPTKRPTTLAPNQSIVVSVGSSSVLSRAVQEAAFAAGFTWVSTGASVLADVISKGKLVVLLLNRRNQHVYWQLATAPLPSDWSNLLHLDARTDMGLLIDLLSAPSAPKPIVGPTINGYVGAYTKGADIIVFGCAQISVHMLRALSPAMMSIHGNRTVASMTLSSGVTITREQIAAILSYVDQVNKG